MTADGAGREDEMEVDKAGDDGTGRGKETAPEEEKRRRQKMKRDGAER